MDIKKSLWKLTKKHSGTILTTMGVVGLIVTSISSSKASLKVNDIKINSRKDDIHNRDLIKPYIPTVIFGLATTTCLIYANLSNRNKQKSLLSAGTLVCQLFKNYRETLIELYGEEYDEEVRNTMILNRTFCDYHRICLDSPDKKVTFYEEISGQYLDAYEREIMDAEYHINRNFTLKGEVPLNEFLQFLGLDEIDGGDDIGWSNSCGYSWIDFTHRQVCDSCSDKVYYAISSTFYPCMLDDD